MPALSSFLLCLVLLLAPGGAALAYDFEDAKAITPARLSHIDGDVSFLRDGAEDWFAARLNTPLAVGDELYAGAGATFELQIGVRSYVRVDERSQVALSNQGADFMQFRVNSGRVSLDLRRLDPGMTIEVATPDAVFIIANEGYYRLDVDGDTRFVTRRGGRASVIPAGGRAMTVLPSEEIVVRGGDRVRVESYVAPEPDRWDRWNFARSDDLIDAVSSRYLPPGVYGAEDLDRHGDWRVVADYGPIWIPDRMPRGWAPYSTGSWVWDPYYEWTWIDDAPWGWAPFHYGRWVYLDGYWAWAPGPVVRRPVYSPALVAFFWAGDDLSIRFRLGLPGVYWVSLSWGEPLIPWWGKADFRGRPWWGGWHGPRVVNNVVVKNVTVVNVNRIVYRNASHERAVAYVPRDHFGRPQERARQAERLDLSPMTRLKGDFPVKPSRASLAVDTRRASPPPKEVAARQVVATRKPKEIRLPWPDERRTEREAARPPVRVVPQVSRQAPIRPEFGQQGQAERPRPALPPRYREASTVDGREARPEPAAPPVRETREIQATPPRLQKREVPAGRDAARVGEPRQVTPSTPPRVQEREIQPVRPTPAVRDVRTERPAEDRMAVEGKAQAARDLAREAQRPLPGSPANRMYRRGSRDGER